MVLTRIERFLCGRRRSAKRFVRDPEGATAVEFALVAPIFFATLLSIIEITMIFGTTVMLDAAANRASREIRTGKIYLDNYNVATDPVIDPDTGDETCPNEQACSREEQFLKAMCRNLVLIRCDEIKYNVEVFGSFSDVATGVYCDGSGGVAPTAFEIGDPNETVVVTIAYLYRPIIPNPLSYSGRDWRTSAQGGCNGLMLQSTVVFRNEPFPRAP